MTAPRNRVSSRTTLRAHCQYDDLSESYSGDADSYRAVGIDAKRNTMVVYFYNG